MCDSLTIIDHGKLVFSGTVDALAAHMSGNAPIRMRLAQGGDDVEEKAVNLLKQFPGVTTVAREESGLLSVAFDGDDQAAAALLRTAVESLPVADFHRASLNLEKVFMEVTQND